MKDILKKILDGNHLNYSEASDVMRMIMDGRATEAQLGAFLAAEKIKGEQVEELTAFAKVMREKSVKIKVKDPNAIDMCGTGGDGSGTFNISTVASFVVAGAGVTVAKHGNKSISSKCGSADLLSELGVDISIPPEKVEKCINEIGIGFMLAPTFHPAMRNVSKARSDLGVKTFFNILGPLTNPAEVKYQLVGAFSIDAAKKLADVFSKLGVKKAIVVHSKNGLDEISLDGETIGFVVEDEKNIKQISITPDDYGLTYCNVNELQGGDAEFNSQICKDILTGDTGAKRDIVLLNAAFGIFISGKSATPNEGIEMARESIYSGKALKKLNQLIEMSRSL